MAEPVRNTDPDLEQNFFDRGESESSLIALHALSGEIEVPRKRWNPYVMGAGVAIGLVLAVWIGRPPAKPRATASVEPDPAAVVPAPAPAAAASPTPAAATSAAGPIAVVPAAPAPAAGPGAPAPAAAPEAPPLAAPAGAGATQLVPARAQVGQTSAAADDIAACRAADEKGRIKDVLAVCRKVMEAEPAQPDALIALARAALERGRPGYCFDLATRAAAAKPDLADAYALIGTVEQERGRVAVARTNYKKYLELAPRGRYAADLRAVLSGL